MAEISRYLRVPERVTPQRKRTSYEQNSIKPPLPHLRVPGAVPLNHDRIPEDEVHHPLTPQMIVLKALAKQPATFSIGQNYTQADSRTPLLGLRTCPPSSFWGFLEINFLEFFHSTMLKYGQSHTCAGNLAPPRRLLSNFYSNPTKAAEQSVLLALTMKSNRDHLSLQMTSFSLRQQYFFVRLLMQKGLKSWAQSLSLIARCKVRPPALWCRMTLRGSRHAAIDRERAWNATRNRPWWQR